MGLSLTLTKNRQTKILVKQKFNKIKPRFLHHRVQNASHPAPPFPPKNFQKNKKWEIQYFFWLESEILSVPYGLKIRRPEKKKLQKFCALSVHTILFFPPTSQTKKIFRNLQKKWASRKKNNKKNTSSAFI